MSLDEVAMVAGLVRKAKDQGLALTGPGGLLKSLTKTVLETATGTSSGSGPGPVAASPRSPALKTLYLVVRSLDPKGNGQTRWVTRSKPALNAFAITFTDRMSAAEDR